MEPMRDYQEPLTFTLKLHINCYKPSFESFFNNEILISCSEFDFRKIVKVFAASVA